MTDPIDKSSAKAQKKAAKALAKAQKKGAPQQQAPDEQDGPAPHVGPTPAERSATAAERQVVLHRRRFWVSLLGVLVAIVSLIVSVFVWQRSSHTPADAPPVVDEATESDD